MKHQSEHTTPFFVKIAEYPWVQGPVLGAGVMTLVTPLLKWTNHTYNGEKMPKGNYFSGAGAYALSAIPGYATTFVFKALLCKNPDESSVQYRLFSSFSAGALSGLIGAPFESIAQNKQLSHSPSLKRTAYHMYSHHGYKAFFQGGISVMGREGFWSMAYLDAIQIVSLSFQQKGVSEHYADMLATLTVAGTYGLLSSPLNQLRYRKQLELTTPTVQKSYLQHMKEIYNQKPTARPLERFGGFFKAAVPRAVTTTVAAGLMVKGTEYYQHTIDALKP